MLRFGNMVLPQTVIVEPPEGLVLFLLSLVRMK
jgi:hypothetical protein